MLLVDHARSLGGALPRAGAWRPGPFLPPGADDRFGFRHSSQCRPAIAAFERAVFAVAAHKPSASAELEAAIGADPDLVAAHALKGFAQVLLARAELLAGASAALSEARRALRVCDGGTADERALTSALAYAVQGRLAAAAELLDGALDRNPTAFLPAKIAHSLRFMLGDARGMLATTARALKALPERRPGHGFLLGCHAFALEELGEYGAAERAGRRAVEIEPDDAWALHAVSHVHEMQGRTAEGIAWLEDSRPVWTACNNFGFHMAWHLAICHLERADHERVLQLYDTEVRPAPSDDFRDVANAVSLLWRLEQEGVAVGARWDELKVIALRRRHETTLAFATLHHLLALVAVGELGAARELLGAMEANAETGRGDQAEVMDAVGVELASAILDLALHRAPRAELDRLATRLHRIGGSNAQRDVFVRTLAATAADRGDAAALKRILAVRRRLKRDDRFVGLVEGWLAQAHSRQLRRSA